MPASTHPGMEQTQTKARVTQAPKEADVRVVSIHACETAEIKWEEMQ